MAIIPQTLHRCRSTQRYIFSISATRKAILSYVRCVVRLQTIYITFRHVVWVAANTLTALKTWWLCAANIMKCTEIGNNGRTGYKRYTIWKWKVSDEIPNHNGDSNKQMAAGFLRKGRQARSKRLTAAPFTSVVRNVRRENHEPLPKQHTDILPCPGGGKCS